MICCYICIFCYILKSFITETPIKAFPMIVRGHILLRFPAVLEQLCGAGLSMDTYNVLKTALNLIYQSGTQYSILTLHHFLWLDCVIYSGLCIDNVYLSCLSGNILTFASKFEKKLPRNFAMPSSIVSFSENWCKEMSRNSLWPLQTKFRGVYRITKSVPLSICLVRPTSP